LTLPTERKHSVPPTSGARGLFIKLGLSLLIAGFFVYLMRQGALELWPGARAFDRVQWSSVALYVVLLGFQQLVRAGRWYFLLAPVQRVPLTTVIRVAFIGFLAIAIAPIRTGEVVRPLLMRREGKISGWVATGTVAAERAIDGFFLSLLLFVSLMLAKPNEPLPDRIGDLPIPVKLVPAAAYWAVTVFTGALVVMALFYLFRHQARRLIEGTVGLVSLKLARALADRIGQVADGLRFLPQLRYTVPFLLGTLAYWSIATVAWRVLAVGCGLELSYFQAAATMGVVCLGILVPNAPGFFGAFQFGCYAGLAMYLDRETVLGPGAVYVFLTYALQMLFPVVTGIIALALKPDAIRGLYQFDALPADADKLAPAEPSR
jgi:glycosyltransferase 2 family protein